MKPAIVANHNPKVTMKAINHLFDVALISRNISVASVLVLSGVVFILSSPSF